MGAHIGVYSSKSAGSQNVVKEETTFFLSGREEVCVEKRVVWKIENFSQFLTQLTAGQTRQELVALFRKGITFQAGKCLLKDGTLYPATWLYVLSCEDEDDNRAGGFLMLRNVPRSKVKCAKASHSVTLSSGGEHIVSVEKGEVNLFNALSSAWGCPNLGTKAELLEKTRGSNVLEVTLDLKVFSSTPEFKFSPVLQSPSTSRAQVEGMRGQMAEDFRRMLENGNGADVDIKVPKDSGGDLEEGLYIRKAHKHILGARSSVFFAMFEQEMTEAQNGEVVIPDLSPKGLDVFLHFLYTGEVLESWRQVPGEILNSAEKYDLGGLKKYCGDNLISAVTTSNAWELYQVAKLHKLHFAKGAIAEFVSKNATAVLEDDN